MNSYSEAVQKAMKGEQEAFTYLYEKTYTKVFYLARKFLKSEHIAQDIVQDSYVKAFQSLNTLEDPEKFPSWIATIVTNRSKNELKRRKETLFSETENEDGQDISDTFIDDRIAVQPEIAMDKNETKRLMQEIIDTLTDEQRMCITMFYMEEMSVKEMASVLEVSENTVKSRLNYGRQKIKDKVLDLEKKGTKLYGLAPIPFFLLLLKEDVKAAQSMTIPPMSAAVKAATTGGITTASTSTVAGTTAAVAGKGIATKVIIGVVAGVLVVGGGTAAAIHMHSGSQTGSNADIPSWVNNESYINGIKYVSMQGYEYPLALELYDDENTECGDVRFLSNISSIGYVGMKGNYKKNWYFGEYEGYIYYSYKFDSSSSDIKYNLFRVPKGEYYNMFAENPNSYTDAIFDYMAVTYNEKHNSPFPYDENEHDQYEMLKDMINEDGYDFDGWYCISEDDLFQTGTEAYNDWLINGDDEMNKIYASHIVIVDENENSEETEIEETQEPEQTATETEANNEETTSETNEDASNNQSQNIPVPTYTATGNFWNEPGTYSNSSGQNLYYSQFTEDGGVDGWCGNIESDIFGTLQVFYYGDGIYYLKDTDNSYSTFTDSGYAFTLEPSGEIIDYYGEIYDKILLKLYYNGVLQGEYYEIELYQS